MSLTSRLGSTRSIVGAATCACLSIVWAHAFAAVLGVAETVEPSVFAWPLTGLALLVSLAASVVSRPSWAWSAAVGIGFVAGGLWYVVTASAPGVVIFPALAVFGVGAARWIGRHLPTRLDGVGRPRRLRSLLWLFSVVVAIVQLCRLSTWMTDPTSDWFLTTRDPFWAKHECLPAYLHGAELAANGEANVYDAAHYPALDRHAEPHSALEMTIEDPFQYAPQFLLWPRFALELTHHYPSIKLLWFALQTTLLLGLVGGLASWIGGRTGRVALLLAPLVLSAFPVLHDLQYGQFHLASVMAAVAAMMAFDAGKHRIGGSLLAVAVLSKLFPGVLLFVLAAQRRWRELGWTAVAGAVITAAALLVVGTAPFTAFVAYHLPRLQSGAAFAFQDAWPELTPLMIADNQGVFGLVNKLAALGVSGLDGSAAAWINRGYAVALAALAWLAGTHLVGESHERRAITWLGLVGLGSLMSTGAFGDYVPATAAWLLTLVAARFADAKWPWWLVPTWVLQYTLLGTSPLGDWFDPAILIPVSAIAALSLLVAFAVPVVSGLRLTREYRAPASA